MTSINVNLAFNFAHIESQATMIYSIEQLQFLSQSKLCKAPPFEYSEILIAETSVVESQQEEINKEKYIDHEEENGNESDGSSDSHLDELTSRGNLNKKSNADVSLVPPKFAFASASPSSEPKESRAPRTTKFHAKESQQDSDGWISVGPKHSHGRRSFTGDNNNDRRKFLQGQGSGAYRKKNGPREGNWRRKDSRGEYTKGDVQQFQHQYQQHQQDQQLQQPQHQQQHHQHHHQQHHNHYHHHQQQQHQEQIQDQPLQQHQSYHTQQPGSSPQLSSSPGSKFSSFFSEKPETSHAPMSAPPLGLSNVNGMAPPPGLGGISPSDGVPIVIGPDGNPMPAPPFGNLPPPPPEFLQKFYNGEISAPPSWN